MLRRVLPAALLAVVFMAAGCSGGDKKNGATPTPTGSSASGASSPTPPAPTGTAQVTGGPGANVEQTLCKLLTVADLTAAGLDANKPDTTNTTDVEAFCVFSANTELDVFVSKTPADATDVYNNLITQNGTPTATNLVNGADASAYGKVPAVKRVGVIVRKGKLVYALTIPDNTPDAKTVASNLATIALGRTTGLT